MTGAAILESNRAEFFGCKKGIEGSAKQDARRCIVVRPRAVGVHWDSAGAGHGGERKRNKGHREDQHGMRQIFHELCHIIAIGAEISSSFRGRPNRKWPTHARWSLRRSWRHVDAGSVPRVGQAFSFGAGSRGLAGLQAVKGAAAPTGIVHALDAERILRYASLGRSRNVIDRPESCCSE